MRLPNLIRPCATGDRTAWTKFPCGWLRSLAMVPTGLMLGCVTPPSEHGLPTVMTTQGLQEVPVAATYVGNGDRRLELPASEWALGAYDGEDAAVRLLRYATDLDEYNQDELRDWLAPLVGRVLLCDCKQGVPCHAFILAGAIHAIFGDESLSWPKRHLEVNDRRALSAEGSELEDGRRRLRPCRNLVAGPMRQVSD